MRLALNGKLALIKSNEANPQNEKTSNCPDCALLPGVGYHVYEKTRFGSMFIVALAESAIAFAE